MKKTMFVLLILVSAVYAFSQDSVESVVELNILLENGYSQEAIDSIAATNLALRDEYSQAFADSVAKVNALLEDGLMENQDNIFAESLKLTPNRREILYEAYKMDNTGPFLLNLLVGFGSGSFAQGDMIGGGIAAGGDVLGLLLLGIGFIQANEVVDISDEYGSPPGTISQIGTDAAPFIMIGGGLIYVGSRIFQSIRAFNYGDPSTFNETLKNSLGVGEISFFAYPTFNINTSESGFTASTRIEF